MPIEQNNPPDDFDAFLRQSLRSRAQAERADFVQQFTRQIYARQARRLVVREQMSLLALAAVGVVAAVICVCVPGVGPWITARSGDLVRAADALLARASIPAWMWLSIAAAVAVFLLVFPDVLDPDQDDGSPVRP
jgi:hypothetical protein